MKVADLIRVLQAFPLELEVYIETELMTGPALQLRSVEAQVGDEIKEIVLISDQRS